MRQLRVDEQPRCRRKGWSFRFLWKPGDAEGPANSRRAAEHLRRQFDKTGELGCPAGQNDATPRLGRERRGGKPVADHFQNFLDARLDDAHQLGARNEMGRAAIVVLDRG